MKQVSFRCQQNSNKLKHSLIQKYCALIDCVRCWSQLWRLVRALKTALA